jgi:hypothetical protein
VRQSRILSLSAAVAAVALSASPGMAAVRPAGKRSDSAIVALPLLALHKSDIAVSPYSHSSHVSHSSHFSSSHSSHASHSSHSSHSSHYSSAPYSPPPSPVPSPVTTQSQSAPSHHAGAPKLPKIPRPSISSTSASPSPSQSTSPSPSATTISPRPTANDSSPGDVAVDVIVGLAALGGVTFYIYRKNYRSR